MATRFCKLWEPLSQQTKHTQNDVEDDFTDSRDTKDHVEEDKTNDRILGEKTESKSHESSERTDGEKEKGEPLQGTLNGETVKEQRTMKILYGQLNCLLFLCLHSVVPTVQGTLNGDTGEEQG